MSEGRLLIGGTDYLIKCSENQVSNRYWTLVYVKSGNGVYSIESSLKGLSQGDMIIIPPKVEYSFSSSELGDEYNINLCAFVLRFDETWLEDVLRIFPSMSSVALGIKEIKNHYSIQGPKWMKISSILDSLSTIASVDQPVRILSILNLISSDEDMILIKYLDDAVERSLEDRKDRIDRYISCNLNSKLSLQEIADYLGMSRTYFSIFFKRIYHEGFSDYLNRKRVENAARMLLKTELSIPMISSECGFRTVQYFSRAFKKVMGVPPGEYRKS